MSETDPNVLLGLVTDAVGHWNVARDDGDKDLADSYAETALNHFQRLDEWLGLGGELPDRWGAWEKGRL